VSPLGHLDATSMIRPMTALECIVHCTILLVSAHGAIVSHSAHVDAALIEDSSDSLVQSFDFKQDLVVCNAYESNDAMVVNKNGKQFRAKAHGIPFKQCQQIPGRLQSKEKIDVVFGKIQGSFQIGDIPPSDSFLLLVVERRDATSPLLAFKSYAFPTQGDGQGGAHLAVIDAFKGNSTLPSLRMEDHVTTGKESKMMSKRVEQLHFNRIYNIEQGTYDASILEHIAESDQQVTKGSKKVLHVRRNRNYVVLRTGDGHSSQSLSFYPELSGGALRSGVAALTTFIAFALLEHAMELYPLAAWLV